MDKYSEFRGMPLLGVLEALGFTGWKKRSNKEEWYGLCPIHLPEKNSTAFSFTDTVFNCFSCGAKGSGAIDLVMQVKAIPFKEAVGVLQTLQSAVPASSNGHSAGTTGEALLTQNKPFQGTYEKYYVASEFLANRGLTEETLKFFGVGEYRNPSRHSGYAGKIMIPIHRPDGTKVGYLARDPKGEPKYLFPKGFQKSLELFGAYHLKNPKCVFLVESPFCVMKFRQMGFPAVSPFGWRISREQLFILAVILRPRGVVYLPDLSKYDEAQSVAAYIASCLWLKCPPLPVEDPEQLTPEQIKALL